MDLYCRYLQPDLKYVIMPLFSCSFDWFCLVVAAFALLLCVLPADAVVEGGEVINILLVDMWITFTLFHSQIVHNQADFGHLCTLSMSHIKKVIHIFVFCIAAGRFKFPHLCANIIYLRPFALARINLYCAE